MMMLYEKISYLFAAWYEEEASNFEAFSVLETGDFNAEYGKSGARFGTSFVPKSTCKKLNK